MPADSKQIIKALLLVRCNCNIHMSDGLVQLCLPARWLGTSIGTKLGSEASVKDKPADSDPTSTDVFVSQLQLI